MSLLSIERQPPLRLVQLDTGKRNVLTLEAVEALSDAISPDHEAPVVVLSGRPDGFCSGLDNATLAKGDVEREELLARMAELLLVALEGPTRIVAACGGHAVAAGAMLLLVADVRIGARGGYKIGFTEPRLGMPLPELPALLARERLDRRRLHELTVLGRTVDPEGAESVGFLDELTTQDDLRAVAIERARAIAPLSDAAYRGTIASVWGSSMKRIRALVEEQGRRLSETRKDAALHVDS
jgi:enoyl-CoA hydratase